MKISEMLRRLMGGSEKGRVNPTQDQPTENPNSAEPPKAASGTPKPFVRMIGDATQDDVHSALIAWMSTRGPDEWHAVARQWNWDFGAAPLEWIIAQEHCDRATAATLFWRSSPDTILSCNTVQEAAKAFNKTGFIVASAIADRAVSNGFERAEIASDDKTFADPAKTKATWARWCEHHAKNVDLPDWMFGPFSGRIVEYDFPEGLPRPVIEMVYPGWEEGWGD